MNKKYKIGNLKLKNPYLLAPMLEPNDIAFRLLCKKASCALTFTGMTSPRTKHKQILKDKPALQIFANSPEGINTFIKKYDKQISMWDFNLGCPSKLSARLKHGAFMHRDMESIKKIFEIMRESTNKPCSVKLRKSTNAIGIAKLAEEKGFDAVTIHARTFKQGYSGVPDYNFALKLKKTINIPVIYSGDVDVKNAKNILKDFDFVMIGRAAIGNPNIFAKLTNKNKPVNFRDYLKLIKKYKQPWKTIKYQAMAFTKGEKGAKKMRRELISAKNIKDVKKVYSDK